jgi:tetratricopeptide (TPR) repeat protein
MKEKMLYSNFTHIKRRRTALIFLPAILFAVLFAGWQTADMQAKLTLGDILTGLRSKKVPPAQRNKLLTDAVRQRGVTFTLTPEIEEELRGEGANNVLIEAIRQKSSTPLPTPRPTTSIRPTPAPSPGSSANNFAKLGDDFYDKGDYTRAIENYNRAIQLDPQLTNAYMRRGFIYHYQGETSRALAEYRTAIVKTPSRADEAYVKCLLYDTATGNANRAISECTEAIAAFPKFGLIYYKRGTAYNVRQVYDKAFDDFNQTVLLSPNSIIGYLGRSSSYINFKKDYDRAIADCNAVIRINPQSSAAYYNRGISYYNKSDHDNAIADYTLAIRYNSRDFAAYNNRALSYEVKGNIRAAIDDLRKALQIKPDYETAKNNLKRLEAKTND